MQPNENEGFSASYTDADHLIEQVLKAPGVADEVALIERTLSTLDALDRWDEKRVLGAALSGVGDADRQYLLSMPPADRELLRAIILDPNNHELLDMVLDTVYEERPVPMQQFLEDPYYMGSTASELYPKLKQDLIEIFEGNYMEIVLGGSIGWGKSTITEYGLIRLAYETLCLRDPQRFHGLMGGTDIVIVNLSVTEEQARKAVFAGVKKKIDQSPFFRREMPPNPRVQTVLRFPKNLIIQPGASAHSATIGLNLISGVIDESNFMPVRAGSATRSTSVNPLKRAANKNVYDKAADLADRMMRRIKSRFLTKGVMPGKVFLISSAQYPGDFTDRKMREALTNPSIFVRSYSQWSVHPSKFSDETFKVEIGTESQGSRILTGREEPQTVRGMVIDVPVDLLAEFRANTEEAVRDLAGISTLAVDTYLKQFQAVLDCVNVSRKHPYTTSVTTLADNHGLVPEAYLNRDLMRDGVMRPASYPEAIRVAHIDPSINRDATGLAVGHIGGYKEVLRRQSDGSRTTERAPIIVFDLLLRIVAPPDGEIDFSRVRDIIYRMRDHGHQIALVTTDTFQSAEYGQQLRKRKIDHSSLSVDRDMTAYETLKQALLEGRVDMYPYEPALSELRRLEVDYRIGKVDHPVLHGSKDVTDAMAAVALMLTVHGESLKKRMVDVSIW